MAVVLNAHEVWNAPRFVLTPPLGVPPTGLSWAWSLVPSSASSAEWLRAAVLISAAFALVGLFARVAATVTAALLLFLLALPQQWGSSLHTHHLWWFTLLLAASPCGDALSVDAWRRGTPAPTSIAHGLPVRAAWVSVGLIFLFPGVWKLRSQGLDWALSDNLLHQLWFKWLEHGAIPPLRIDQAPVLLKAGGLGVLLLEMGALPLLLWKRTRVLTAVALLGFHLATQAFFFIGFSSLWVCYLVFVPWSAWLRRPSSGRALGRSPLPAGAVAVAVLSGQLVTGLLGLEHGLPFACYPTFRHDPGSTAAVVVVEEQRGGTLHELPRAFLRGSDGQQEWSAMWALLGRSNAAALLAWWRPRRDSDAPVEAVTFFLGAAPVDPARWAEPVHRDRVLLRIEDPLSVK